MKIGMIVNNLEVSGGYQKLVIRLAQQLKVLGNQVIVYTPKLDTKNCYPEDISSIQVVSLPKNLATLTPVEAYKTLVAKVDPQPDALIIHDELSLLGVALLPPLVHTQVIWMLNNQLSEDLKKYRPEILSVYHQTVGPWQIKLHEIKKAALRVHLLRLGLRRVDIFATYDEYNKRLVQKVLKRNEVKVVSAGADLDQFKTYASTHKPGDKKLYNVLSVGVVFPHRRYQDLIEAVEILDIQGYAVQATIVGRHDLSPAYFKSLKSLVKQLGIEKNIIFKNYVTSKEMVQLYKDSGIFIFINDGFTWGISVFEAVAAKLPIVITDNIGAADLVKNNETGWVVTPQSPKEVAAAIKDIIDSPSRAEAVTKKAYEQITPFVTWEAYTNRMLELIKS